MLVSAVSKPIRFLRFKQHLEPFGEPYKIISKLQRNAKQIVRGFKIQKTFSVFRLLSFSNFKTCNAGTEISSRAVDDELNFCTFSSIQPKTDPQRKAGRRPLETQATKI